MSLDVARADARREGRSLLGRVGDPRAVAWACGVAAASLLAAFWMLPGVDRFFFVWDHNFSSAVSYACGHALADITQPVPELVDFLNRRRSDFDCGLLPAGVQLGPLNAYANGIPYFLRALGFYWRWNGVSWSNLAPLFGVLYAVSNVLVFFLFREFLGNRWAFLVALAYIVSPSNYYSLTYYEHYAKVPIFLGDLLIVVRLVRSPVVTRRQLVAAAIAGGLLLGVGFGIRADLWLLTVPVLAALLFSPGVAARPSWQWRSLACAAALAVCTAAALPALLSHGRSYFWLQLVEGLSTDFDADLSVRPAIYEWLPRYNDELGASWMQTHALYHVPRLPSVPRLSGDSTLLPPAPLDWQAQEEGGMVGYLAVVRNFPADFVTRPLAAALKVIVDSFRTQYWFAAQFAATGPGFFTRTTPIWLFIAPFGAWLVFLLAAELLALAVRQTRQALFFLLLVLYIGGTTAIVFQVRHRWHLYFIGFLVAGVGLKFLVDQAIRLVAHLRRPRADVSLAAGFRDAVRWSAAALPGTLLVIALAGAVILLTRVYQDHHVGQLLEQVLAAGKDQLRIEPQRPDAAAPQVVVAPDLVTRFDAFARQQESFQYGDYLMATFSRDECSSPQVKLVYQASQAALDHSANATLDFNRGSRFYNLVFPAYAVKAGASYGYFKGVSLAVGSERCLAVLSRVRDPGALPLLITWRIPERWESVPRHQSIVFPPADR